VKVCNVQTNGDGWKSRFKTFNNYLIIDSDYAHFVDYTVYNH